MSGAALSVLPHSAHTLAMSISAAASSGSSSGSSGAVMVGSSSSLSNSTSATHLYPGAPDGGVLGALVTLGSQPALDVKGAIGYAFVWFLIWGVLHRHYTRKYAPWMVAEHPARIISFLHAIASFLFACVSLVGSCLAAAYLPAAAFHGGNWFLMPTSVLHQLCLIPSLSYFVVDTIWILADRNNWDITFLGHHSISLSCLGYAIFSGMCGWEISVCLVACEAANPFMHLRWIVITEHDPTACVGSAGVVTCEACTPSSSLSSAQLVRPKPYAAAVSSPRALHIMTELQWWLFTIVRLGLGSIYTAKLVSLSQEPLVFKISGTAMMIFSFMWWFATLKKRSTGAAWK